MSPARVLPLVVACAAIAASARPAHAAPRVLLVEDPAGPSLPALAAQVRLQVGDVELVAIPGDGAAGPAYVATATALAAEHDAVLVVWVTQEAGDDAMYVVYAVGRSPERAVIELVRVEASTPPSEVERVIALKLASLLDDVLAPAPVVTVLGVPAAPTVARVPREIAGAPAPPRWWLDLGVAVAASGGDRGVVPGVELAASRRWGGPRSSIGARLAARWLPSHRIDDPLARVSLVEVDGVAGLDAAVAAGPVQLVGVAGVGAAIVRASGATPDGRTGSRTEVIPLAGAAAGVRLEVTGPVVMSVSVGHERALVHQRFLVDGEVVADLGRGRWLVAAAMSVALP